MNEVVSILGGICEGVAGDRIAPLGDNPAHPVVTFYRDGRRAVSCPYLDQASNVCRATGVPWTSLEKCVQMFPTLAPGGPEYDNRTWGKPSEETPCNTPAGTFTIDFALRKLHRSPFWPDGTKPKHLTPTETLLLEALVENQGRVVTRADLNRIVAKANGQEPLLNSRSQDCHIARLRQKLSDTKPPTLIRSIRGGGYSIPLKKPARV